jgi:arylsulfatase A-like enzyme
MARTRAELVDDGLELTQAFMTTPLCCPSRASILSGSYAHRTGVYRNDGSNGGADDFDDASTLATWLQGVGYRTSLIGKYLNGYPQLWNQNTEPPYVPPGWTEWRGMRNVAFFNYRIVEPDGMGGYTMVQYGSDPEDYSTDVLREKAKTFISDSVALGEPFFLYLAFKAPHLPQIPAPRHEGMFQNLPPWRPPSYNEADVSDKPTWLQSQALQASAELDQIRIDQLEMVQAVDEASGGSTTYGITGIMQHLRDLGIADNTIVVYTTDNGAEVFTWPDGGTTPFRGEKATNWEGGFRVPMVIRWPGVIKPGIVVNDIGAHEDLIPTFAAAAGEPDLVAKVKKGYAANGKNFKVHLDGYNLMPFLKGEVEESPRKEFLYWSDDGDLFAIRVNEWKVSFLEQHTEMSSQYPVGVWQGQFNH